MIESHTGGEPFRIVVDGVGPIPGDTVLERRRYAEAHLDDVRRALMWEPRGHADMYGCFISPPVRSDSDLTVLFMHNEGFSTMCGHGIIALTKVAIDCGIVTASSPETTIRIDSPAGQVTATAPVTSGVAGPVRFTNVASYVDRLDAKVDDVPGIGRVRYDIAFGGAYYAYVDAAELGVDLEDPTRLIAAGRAIKTAIVASAEITHPFEADLGFLYGVIFTGPPTDPVNHSRNVCVFAEGEVDRSPTGTGLSGRLAIHYARGELGVDEPIIVESIVGSTFTGRIVKETHLGEHRAIIPEVEGEASILGRSEFWLDPDDEVGRGFFLR